MEGRGRGGHDGVATLISLKRHWESSYEGEITAWASEDSSHNGISSISGNQKCFHTQSRSSLFVQCDIMG